MDALEKVAWVVVRQRGGHVRLKHELRSTPQRPRRLGCRARDTGGCPGHL
ncbi:MAG: type II toxin-antitoxin system HicA family toxin [Solirubrobacteraceae bacterium]